MSISKKIRNQSKILLRNNWVSSLVAIFVGLASNFIIFSLMTIVNFTLLYFKISESIINIADLAVCVISLIMLSPVFNGIMRFFYHLSLTHKADTKVIFASIKGKKYWKTLLFNLYMTSDIIILTIALVLSITCYDNIAEIVPQYAAIGIVIFCCLVLLSTIVFLGIYKIISFFLFADDSDKNFRYYRKVAGIINKKHIGDMINLFFSFTFWLLSCYFILPLFYVFPYISTSFATSAKWLIKIYKDGKMV